MYYKTKFDVSLSDMSIYSILKNLKISRKRVNINLKRRRITI